MPQDVVGRPARGAARRRPVELEELVDLALALAHRGLVERELHPVVAVRDDLAHQGGVVGGDVVADELRHVHEAHDAVVEVDPARPSCPARRCRRRGRGPGRVASGRPPCGLTAVGRAPRSPGDRGRVVGALSTNECRVSPYAAIAAIRTVPNSSLTSSGSCRMRRAHLARAGSRTCRRPAPRGRCRRRRHRGRGGGRGAGCRGRRRP